MFIVGDIVYCWWFYPEALKQTNLLFVLRSLNHKILNIYCVIYELRALSWHIVNIWKMRNPSIRLVVPFKSDQWNRLILPRILIGSDWLVSGVVWIIQIVTIFQLRAFNPYYMDHISLASKLFCIFFVVNFPTKSACKFWIQKIIFLLLMLY